MEKTAVFLFVLTKYHGMLVFPIQTEDLGVLSTWITNQITLMERRIGNSVAILVHNMVAKNLLFHQKKKPHLKCRLPSKEKIRPGGVSLNTFLFREFESDLQFPTMNMDRLPFYEAKVLFSEGRGRM